MIPTFPKRMLTATCIYLNITSTTIAAEFTTEQSTRHGVWTSSLFKNINGNRLFCATETRDGNTEFRINRYKDSGETFLEVFNPNWTMMEGDVRFSISFYLGQDNYSVELKGRSWGDSYTHDFTDVKYYAALLSLLSQAKTFNVLNSNGSIINQFSGIGSEDAIQKFTACVKS